MTLVNILCDATFQYSEKDLGKVGKKEENRKKGRDSGVASEIGRTPENF